MTLFTEPSVHNVTKISSATLTDVKNSYTSIRLIFSNGRESSSMAVFGDLTMVDKFNKLSSEINKIFKPELDNV